MLCLYLEPKNFTKEKKQNPNTFEAHIKLLKF